MFLRSLSPIKEEEKEVDEPKGFVVKPPSPLDFVSPEAELLRQKL